MCRHLAYVGEPVGLADLLIDPPHSLYRQSWAPRRQTSGVVNADGFGVGWYVDGHDVPARHRGAGPVWADETFADLARVVRSGAVLAAVRSATPGMAPGIGAAAPFRDGAWLFSHNGAVAGWPQVASRLAWGLDPGAVATADAATDSALLWVRLRELLRSGKAPDAAVEEVVAVVAAAGGGTVNLLITDGTRIVASAAGASLSWRRDHRGVVVASEPGSDDTDWQDVPDGSLVTATTDGVEVRPLQ